jgi:TPR repeat protein
MTLLQEQFNEKLKREKVCNNPLFTYELGTLYEYGIGVKRDKYKAKQYYDEALKQADQMKKQAEAANATSFAQLVWSCTFDDKDIGSITRDETQAVAWARKAADKGNAIAQARLGFKYYMGHGVDKDYKLAAYCFTESGEKGYAVAQYNLAYLFECGLGVDKNIELAKQLYIEAKNQGYEPACNQLGMLYFNNKDYETAAKYFKEAAEYEDISAYNNLGGLYRNFIKDKKSAIFWYQKSVDKNDLTGLLSLAFLYKEEKDYKKAIILYQRAEAQGSDKAQFYLGYFHHMAKGLKKDYKKAIEFYEKAAKQGNNNARTNLALLYQDGKGTPKDLKKAHDLLLIPANENYADAENHLGLVYHQGLGVPKNLATAYIYYEKAIEHGCEVAKGNIKIIEKKMEKDPKLKKEVAVKKARKAATKAQTAPAKPAVVSETKKVESKDELRQRREEAVFAKRREEERQMAESRLQQIQAEKKEEAIEQLSPTTASEYRDLGLFFINNNQTENAFINFSQGAKLGDAQSQNYLAYMYQNGVGIKENHEEAMQWYTASAEQGYVIAQFNLGHMYQNGLGLLLPSYRQALYWYEKAAEKNYPQAQNNIGYLYQHGLGLDQDYQIAANYYLLSAVQNYAAAQYNLGYLYHHGLGVEQDYDKALLLYKKADEQNYKLAKANLENIQVVIRDRNNFQEEFEKASKENDPVSQYLVALCYESGIGVQDNHVEKEKWFERALAQLDKIKTLAETDTAKALFVLGHIYQVKEDHDKAFKLFSLAAEKGYFPAQTMLGYSYRLERGVPSNNEQAKAWFEKAAAQGCPIAINNLGFLYRYGKGVDKNKPKAVEYFQIAAECEYSNAQYNLALMYCDGKGVPKTFKISFFWYQIAAERGYLEAQFNLAFMYEMGQSVPKDDEKALYWYRKAAQHGLTRAKLAIKRLELGGDPGQYLTVIENQQLDDIKDKTFLAQGGFGKVYKAKWHDISVVIKELQTKEFDALALGDLERECQLLATMRCPHIVSLYAMIGAPNYGLVMEYMEEGSLRRSLLDKNKAIDENLRLRWAEQIAKGLNFLHKQGVLHRDIKSDNVLLSQNNAKLADFGLSKLAGKGASQLKGVAGTYAWMAPELMNNQPYNEKCDIYSLGVLLWELATRQEPYAYIEDKKLIPTLVANGLPLVIPPDVSDVLRQLIKACCHKDPDKRPSAAEVVQQLQGLSLLENAKDDAIAEPFAQSVTPTSCRRDSYVASHRPTIFTSANVSSIQVASSTSSNNDEQANSTRPCIGTSTMSGLLANNFLGSSVTSMSAERDQASQSQRPCIGSPFSQ